MIASNVKLKINCHRPQGFPVQEVLHDGEVEHCAGIGAHHDFLKKGDAHANDDVADHDHRDAPRHVGLTKKMIAELLQHEECPPMMTIPANDSTG